MTNLNKVVCDDSTCMYNRDGQVCNAFVVKVHGYDWESMVDGEKGPYKHYIVCQTYEARRAT